MENRVIIAGGGPTGLMLACELRLAGVEAVVVEPRTEVGQDAQGMAVHGRTLEIFRHRGLTDRIRPEDIYAWPLTPFAFFWLDLSPVGEDDHTYAFPQWRTERLLRERAAELGADLRLGSSVTGYVQDDEGVTVSLVSADGAAEELRGGYLVGCDGAGSLVRRLAGIDFEASGLGYYGVLGDVTVADGVVPEFQTGLFAAGMFGALPLKPGMLRLMTIEFETDGPPEEVPVTTDELLGAILRVTGTEPKIGEVEWLSRFGGGTRLASRYRDRRVLLAGDAAHVLYISGTQGLNAGIHDAVNLAWKLAARIQGRAPDGLLDTYEQERRPLGEQFCTHAAAQTALMHPLDRIGPLRGLVGELIGIESVNKYLLEVTTLTRYPLPGSEAHPLIGAVVPNVPLSGPRAPRDVASGLHDARGLLLDLSGGKADASLWEGLVPSVEADPVPELDAAVLLIRPDGHVAFADPTGTDTDGLRAALSTWFGAPA